jgi:uncharacterized membrane protein
VIVHLAVALLHVFPRLVYPAVPTTTSVVVAINALGPVWITWFGATGICLVVALRTHRLLHVAHLLTGSSWLAYAFALEVGAIAAHGTHLLPVCTIALAAVHGILAFSYNADMREAVR